MLHIINKAPQNPALANCLRYGGGQATVLLIEDGVYAAVAATAWVERLLESGRQVHVLEPDVLARGLSDRIDPRVSRVDYSGFVELCCQHTPIQSWY